MNRTKPRMVQEPRFKVGDWVSWGSGTHKGLAVVIEDQGPFGLDGEHVYGLREFPLWTPITESGLSERFLEPAEPPTSLPEPHDKFPLERAAWRRLDD